MLITVIPPSSSKAELSGGTTLRYVKMTAIKKKDVSLLSVFYRCNQYSE